MAPPYPLDQALPPDVFTHRWQRSSQYINYPVFSWPWWWRRACVFGPVGLFFGSALALPIGLYTGEWSLTLGSVFRMGPAWGFTMIFGTALGTWVRHQAFEVTRERQLLVVAVIVGIAASYGVKYGYESYLSEAVRPVLRAKGALDAVPMLADIRGLQWFYEFFLAAIIVSSAGGRPLYNYFSELRRWQSHGAAHDILTAQQQRDDADRRLAVLQAQVEPHFLYNTLASIKSLVRNDPDRAEQTIDALVDHLRATLPKLRGRNAVGSALSDQLTICRSYLDVMSLRLGRRFTYSIDVPAAADSLSFPPLMLFSLVENAIKHGIEPKPGPCSIRIVADRDVDSQTLVVSVVDDGAGLREGPNVGIGLANIRSQLATRFGARATLSLVGNELSGVTASIRVPIEAAPS